MILVTLSETPGRTLRMSELAAATGGLSHAVNTCVRYRRRSDGYASAMTRAEFQPKIDAVPKDLYIGGQWRQVGGSETFAVQDPATEEDLAEVAYAAEFFRWFSEEASRRVSPRSSPRSSPTRGAASWPATAWTMPWAAAPPRPPAAKRTAGPASSTLAL